MSFLQKTWFNESSDGSVQVGAPPISADNLNRIEQGIADSIQKDGGTMVGDLILNEDPAVPLQAATKQYVDNNILHFHGNAIVVDDEDVTPQDLFILPEYVDLSKYVGFISTNIDYTVDNRVQLIPWDETVQLLYEGLSSYANVKLSSENKELRFSISASGSATKNFLFDLFLVPMSSRVELTPEVQGG